MFNSTLASAQLHTPYVVDDIVPPDAEPEWTNWLAEIGFLEGEPVSVIARGALGGDPLVVRIGVSTFALRIAEASCVKIRAHSQAHAAPVYENKHVANVTANAN